MKVVILAGGLGSRLSEETSSRPKPMVEIGGQPILWHIMMIYFAHGIRDFVICLGYKGYVIKEYFANFVLHRSNITVDLSTGEVEYCGSKGVPPWRVTLVDTGPDSMTGGRLRRVREHVSDDTFCMTYGDGVGNVDITRLIEQHKKSGLEATLTAAVPPGRYGATVINEGRVTSFTEKPAGDGGHINGGFFVLEPRVIDRISGDQTSWEAEPLQGLARDGQLGSYVHGGFWQPMDTLRDKNQLESLWSSGRAPWKVW